MKTIEQNEKASFSLSNCITGFSMLKVIVKHLHLSLALAETMAGAFVLRATR